MKFPTWLARLFRTTAPTPVPPPIVTSPTMKIDPMGAVLAQHKPEPRPKPFAELFPPAPRPDWVPREAALAMDDALTPAFDFAGQFVFGDYVTWPGFPYLAELTQRPEYRTITETRAKEMTRKWIKLTYKGDEPDEERLDALVKQLEDWHIRDRFRVAAEHDGFFGGAQIYIDTGASDNALKRPLVIDEKTIAKGSVKGFRNIEAVWSYPGNYDSADPLSPHFFKPEFWYVSSKTVHASRLLTMISAEMPDLLKPAYSFRGVSLSQRAKPYIDNWLRTRQSVSDLLHSFSIVVLKTLLQSQIQSGGAWGSVFDRVDIFNATRDNRGAMVIDKESEEMEILAVPLGTLDALQAQSQEQMASVSQIPLVKLLGIQPAGLNSSGDSEIRVFYDNIKALQEHLFGDALRKVLDIAQLHLFGDIDPDVGYEFVPLWQLDEAQEAAVRKTEADAAAVYIQEGVISPEEVRKNLADDENGPYAGLDPDDLPEPPDSDFEASITENPAKSASPTGEKSSGV